MKDENPVAVFIISLILFITAVVLILYNASTGPTTTRDETSSGFPLPNSSWIGAKCPVGCTCFPNTFAPDQPFQKCRYLSNDVLFDCPAECCQPTCV